MDCKNARLVLSVAHPLTTELDDRDKQQLASHLADCPDCGAWAENERRLDEHIGKAVQAVAVPPALARIVVRRLDIARDAWYRAWMVRGAGVAAALLLAVWLGWALWWSWKPAPNLVKILDDVDIPLSSKEQVEHWFAYRKGITMIAPPQFNYNYLWSQGVADFEGKQVPYLIFQDPNKPQAMAQVYVLPSRQFNFDAVGAQLEQGSRKVVEALPHPNNSAVIYVVVYPSGIALDGLLPAGRNARG
jgi:hypothetical protein